MQGVATLGTSSEAIRLMQEAFGWFSPSEAHELHRVAKLGLNVAPAIAEIGSFAGRSTIVLAHACEALDVGRVYAIDPHEGKIRVGQAKELPTLEGFRINLKKSGLYHRVVEMVMPSSDAVIPELVGHTFIDGLHEYEFVRRDLDIALSWSAPGAYISLHDCRENGPRRAVADMIAMGKFERISEVDTLATFRLKGGA